MGSHRRRTGSSSPGGPRHRRLIEGRRARIVAAAGAVSLIAATAYVLTASVYAGAPQGWRAVSDQGWRTVKYEGVILRVPASWPVVDLGARPSACVRLDVHAVYLGMPGPHPRCPASGLGAKTETVQIHRAIPGSPQVVGATRRVTLGGASARTNPHPAVSHTITDLFPAADMQVDLSYGRNPRLIRAVEATVSLTRRERGSQGLARLLLAPIPAGKVQGIVTGRGFDTCSAPSVGTMSAWRGSPYRSIGVYIGGSDEACAQPNLTAWWVNQVERQGWHVFPLYVGPQAPCVNAPGNITFSASGAAAAGTAAAADATVQAKNLGLPAGTPVIYDMEGYSGCGSAVTTFLNSWDRKLRGNGYASGVYESFSNVGDLVHAQRSMTEPGIIFYADWDGVATTNSSYMPRMWTHHQRIHQYVGNSYETYGGITLNIDRDQLDANLGGTPAPVRRPGRPQAAVVDQLGVVRVYDLGSTGALWQDSLGASGRWASGNLGGAWLSGPTAVVGSAGTVRVYAIGPGGMIWERHLPKGGTWSGWWGMRGTWRSSPAAVVRYGTVFVFAVGRNGQLYTDQLGGSFRWSGWTDVGGAALTGNPAVIADHTGTVRVFVRDTHGALWEAHLAYGARWAWDSLHGSWHSDPAAAVGADGTVRVYTVGAGHLCQAILPPGRGWSRWWYMPSSGLVGTPAAVVDHAGVVRVFTRASSGPLEEARLGPGPGWRWDSLHGTWRSDVSAVVGSAGTVRVYAMGTDGHLYEAHLPPGGSWSSWSSVSHHLPGAPG